MKRKNILKNILFVTVLATVLATVAFLLAGCGLTGTGAAAVTEKDTAEAAGTTAASTEENQIIIESNMFKPDNLTVKVGATVTWINNDSYSHTVVDNGGAFESETLRNGDKFSFTFDKEGTYDYFCGLHTFMKGKITVIK